MRKLRCAVYTRKSSEEGLDMAFNSLDAQREACEAYIQSQRAEGWVLLPTAYDDGGYSGGSMERPALARLLEDVKLGLVDVIVVYKVDRLTRSLPDFAKIVDVLDAADASFVSVTQAFNTTTSMGRLTLNVLLSFAQFEREVIAERVRDKIAQSKARGIWMGGTVPYGFRVEDRRLQVVENEAETVRYIYAAYLEAASVRALKERLDAEGIVTRVQQRGGRLVGGGPWGRGALHWLLRNPIYIGKLRHRELLHDGEHQAIVPLDLWEQVQAKLAAGVERAKRERAASGALLLGMIRDGADRPMTSSHTQKGQRRYRYYLSSISAEANAGITQAEAAPVSRIAMARLDGAVREAVTLLLQDQRHIAGLAPLCDAAGTAARLAQAQTTADTLMTGAVPDMRALLQAIDLRVTVDAGSVSASVDATRLATLLDGSAPDADEAGERLALPISIARHATGRAARIVLGATSTPHADPALVTLISRAHRTAAALLDGSMHAGRYSVRIARLAYLAPDITTAILDGKQPPAMTARTLLMTPDLPLDWSEQRHLLAFATPAA